jgi:hypothetical protein
MSQAASISNLCNQRAVEITNRLSNVNNYSKTVELNGKQVKTVNGKELPANVVELLIEKSKLHACQAFLMENMKAKDRMIQTLKTEIADTSSVKFPDPPKYFEVNQIPNVGEEFGWEQLTAAELNRCAEAESFASHIGQFFHKDSVLDRLRKELPAIPAIEWMEVTKDTKTPIVITVHHTADQLLNLHEEIAALHRGYEQEVNYFKAKVKNLTTEENARIAKVNADATREANDINSKLEADYEVARSTAWKERSVIEAEFEQLRQDLIKSTAALRIDVDPRFQKVVDMFLEKLPQSND